MKFKLVKMLTLSTMMFVALAGCSGDVVSIPKYDDSETKTRLALLEARAGLLEASDASQNARLDALEGAVSSMQSELDSVQTQLAALDATDASLQSQINALKAKQTLLTLALATIDFLTNVRITLLQNSINSALTVVNNRLDALESDMAGAQSDLADVLAALAAAQEDLADLQEQVADLEEAGQQGGSAAGLDSYTLPSSGSGQCVSLGNNRWAKRNGSDSVNIYDDNDCDSDDRIARIDQTPQTGDDAYYWLTPTRLALVDGNGSNVVLRVVNFEVQ